MTMLQTGHIRALHYYSNKGDYEPCIATTNQKKEGKKTTKMSSGFEKRMRLTEETDQNPSY
jgi:hypothetical protein